MTQTTSRLALPYPEEGESPDGPVQIGALATRLDLLMATDDQGTLSNRPAPGTRGRYYFVVGDTAAQNNRLYRDNGNTWTEVGASAAVDGPATTGTLRTLGTGSQQAAAGNDGRLSDQRVPLDGSVSSAKIDPSLSPSQGASAATEALRALGTTAGTAAAGNDARLSKTIERTFTAPSDYTPSTTLGTIIGSTFIQPVGTGRTVRLAALRHRVTSGSWQYKLQRSVNDAAAVDIPGFGTTGAPLTAGTTSALIDPADVTLGSGDRIDLVAVGGSSPLGPTVTLLITYD